MIKKILYDILCDDNVVESIKKNEEKLFNYIPELEYEKNFNQKSKWHVYDVWEHTLKVLEFSENDFELRLILLFHDIGKPFSFQDDGNIRHFKGHAKKSADITRNILSKFDFSNDEIESICFYIENHSNNIEKLNIQNKDIYNKLLNIMYLDSNGYAPDKITEVQDKLIKFKK